MATENTNTAVNHGAFVALPTTDSHPSPDCTKSFDVTEDTEDDLSTSGLWQGTAAYVTLLLLPTDRENARRLGNSFGSNMSPDRCATRLHGICQTRGDVLSFQNHNKNCQNGIKCHKRMFDSVVSNLNFIEIVLNSTPSAIYHILWSLLRQTQMLHCYCQSCIYIAQNHDATVMRWVCYKLANKSPLSEFLKTVGTQRWISVYTTEDKQFSNIGMMNQLFKFDNKLKLSLEFNSVSLPCPEINILSKKLGIGTSLTAAEQWTSDTKSYFGH